MASFLTLPVECVVKILIFLPPNEIRKCKRVSRSLLKTIQDSHLQYLLELDVLGYTTSLNPLRSLSLEDKIRILREKHANTRLVQNVPTTKFGLGITPMGANYQFSRGVFARGEPSIDTTRRLNVYQPASQNKQVEASQHLIPDLGLDAQDFRIDPDLDLLVLLEIDTTPANPETDLQMRFHLRSLSTGLVHPLAVVPTIVGNFKFTSTYVEPGFQIVGRLLAISCHTSFRLDTSSPVMCVWDWTTGELIASADIPGRHFAFISEDTFVVPFDRRKWAGQDIIGSLEVFTLAQGRVRHTASLHLPPTPDGPCHSSSHLVFTPPAPLPFPTTPARIYEMGPEGHHLCLHLRAFNIQSAPTQMANGSLFIPSSAILDMLRVKTGSNPDNRSRVHIPWAEWSNGTAWVNNRHVRGSRCCVFGHRVALAVFRPHLSAWEVLIYDLRREDKEKLSLGVMQQADEYLDAVFAGARRPLAAASFLIGPEVIHKDERAGDNPPDIMLDDEHVIVFKEASVNEESYIYVYTL